MLPKNLRGKGSKTIPIFVENALQTRLLKQWNPNGEVEPFLETNPIKAKFGKSVCKSVIPAKAGIQIFRYVWIPHRACAERSLDAE